jgi:hypothetical protein
MSYPKIRIIKEKDASIIEAGENQLIDLEDLKLEKRSIESVLGNKSFFLPSTIDSYAVEWIIASDNFGAICLVPLKTK